MSRDLADFVWEFSSQRGASLMVELVLADQVRDECSGWCWIGVNKIMKRSRLTERSVQGALKTLRDAGAIEIRYGGDGPDDANARERWRDWVKRNRNVKPNSYFMTEWLRAKIWAEARRDGTAESAGAEYAGGQNLPQPPAKNNGHPRKICAETPAKSAGKPVIYKPVNKTGEREPLARSFFSENGCWHKSLRSERNAGMVGYCADCRNFVAKASNEVFTLLREARWRSARAALARPKTMKLIVWRKQVLEEFHAI